jgi:transposase
LARLGPGGLHPRNPLITKTRNRPRKQGNSNLRTPGEEARAKRHARAKARRWAVERTHSWLNRFRSILIHWAKKPANYLALLHLARGIIAWRHALPG